MVARENPGVPERVPAGSGQGHSCGNGFFAARGASPGEAGESQVGNGVPVVFHLKAEAELEQLNGDIADRASPANRLEFIVGIRDWACRLFHSAAQSES